MAVPSTTPIPLPIFIPQSNRAPIPPASETGSGQRPDSSFPLPKLRLEICDLMHPGSRAFLFSTVPSTALEFAVQRVLSLLYLSPKCPTTTVPGTRSITLILRNMGGVAYTTGTELDGDHKEIHFSIEYIDGISKSRKADEILGVLTHEVVHCFAYDAHGTCPGGLIEGIADWVRLNSNLSPPHWTRDTSGKWDAGYQHTAYFLDYLEKRYGSGTISRMNNKLRTDRYNEKAFWVELLGRPVEQLWSDYIESVKEENGAQLEPGMKPENAGEDEAEMLVIEREDARSIDKAVAEQEYDATTPAATTASSNQTGQTDDRTVG